MKYGRFTRILHTLIALGITLEMLLSLVMRMPRPGRVLSPLQSFGYEAHRVLGMAVLAVLVLHWLVFAAGRAYKGVAHFFPWFSRARMRVVWAELRDILRGRIGGPEHTDDFAGAIEGIGLVVGSLLAATGAVLYFGVAPDGTMSGAVRAVREFHEFWGPVLWTYLVVHAGAAMVHVGLGHRSAMEIFRW